MERWRNTVHPPKRERYGLKIVGGEEMAVGRGTGINIISYLISIVFFAAHLMEAK